MQHYDCPLPDHYYQMYSDSFHCYYHQMVHEASSLKITVTEHVVIFSEEIFTKIN